MYNSYYNCKQSSQKAVSLLKIPCLSLRNDHVTLSDLAIMLYEIQRRQYEGHNNHLGYCTNQDP